MRWTVGFLGDISSYLVVSSVMDKVWTAMISRKVRDESDFFIWHVNYDGGQYDENSKLTPRLATWPCVIHTCFKVFKVGLQNLGLLN